MRKHTNPDSHLVGKQSLRWILQLAFLTTVITFVVELCIMLAMPYILPKGATELQEAFFDATLLSIGIALLVLPMMLVYRTRGLRRLNRAVRLQAVLDLHASVSVSSVAGDITYVNDKFCEFSGYERSEIIGQTYEKLRSGHHAPAFFENLIQTIQSGDIWRGDICDRHKNGSLRWVRVTIAPFVNDQGKVTEYYSVRTDITEQKALEAEAQRNRDQVTAILDNLGEAVYTLDAQGQLNYLNAEATRLLGWRLEDAKTSDFQTQVQAPGAADSLLAKNGTVFKVKLKTSPLWFQGENAGTIVVFSDARMEHEIQQRLVQAKEAAEANVRLKGQFLATMSHEIRTPLNGVVGMADLLLDTPLSADQTEIARTIQLSADALMAVINDVLDYSKIEAGQMQLEQTEFSLRSIAEGALDLLAGKAHDKGLTLASVIDTDLPDSFMGDPTRVRQILLNFLSNAVKFTLRGEVLLKVCAAPAPGSSPAWIELSVRDTGVGVADDVKDRLFQPFTQADSSTTREFGGTGLGLSICRRLAEAMGGSVGMESILGKGSTFWVRIPLMLAPKQSAQGRDTSVLLGKQVLIGGDTTGSHAILGQSFAAWGMRHNTFESLAELQYLLGQIKANDMAPPDLLLLGPSFPDSSLLNAVTRLRELGYSAVICCLAHRESADTKAALAALGAVVMQKPIKQSVLLDCLMTVFYPDSAASGAHFGGQRQPGPDALTDAPSPSLSASISAAETPAARPAPTPLAHPLRVPTLPTLRVSKKRLLLAEDNDINQRIALRMLERLGYSADVVANGEQAVAAAQTGQYDLILMDCQMPILDGYGATKKIRRDQAERVANGQLPVRIVAMTANAMHGDKELCIEAGMDDYLSKPIDRRVLGDMLKHWLPEPIDAQT